MRKYKIENELKKLPYGAKTELAETMKISPIAIYNVFKTKNASIKTRKKYTTAFNEAFDTNYTKEELFKLEEVEA